jgi:hypothetical protein
MARRLLYQVPEEPSMDKYSDSAMQTENEAETDREDANRRSLDELSGGHDTFNPRTGEDPGLLPPTEDPRERRLKRHTM